MSGSMTRKFCKFGALLLALTNSAFGQTKPPSTGAPSLSSPTVWERLKIGDGGYGIGMDLANEGTRVMWTDISNGYIWPVGATRWKPCITSGSLPASVVAFSTSWGVWQMRLAPSNSSRVYMLYNATVGDMPTRLYRSDDQCGSFRLLSNFPSMSSTSIGTLKLTGQKIVVDPNNPDVIYVGHNTKGVYRSLDGGATFSVVMGIPPAGNEPANPGMAIDERSGTTTLNGIKVSKKIFIPSYGKGIWQSTDGGANFTQISGGVPTATTPFSTTAPDTIIVVATRFYGASTITGISDDAGLKWTKRLSKSVTTHTVEEWWAVAPTPLTNDKIKVSFSSFNAADNNLAINIFAIAGAETTAPFDTNRSLPGFAAGGPPTISTSGPGIVFSLQVSDSPKPDTGYSCIVPCGVGVVFLQHQIFPSAQTNVRPGAVGALNRGGFVDAIRGGSSLSVETANAKQNWSIDPTTTPYAVLNGKLACDGTYYVSDTNKFAWKWDGTNWTRLMADVGAGPGISLAHVIPVSSPNPAPNCDRIFVDSGRFTLFNQSLDAGVTWVGPKNAIAAGSGVNIISPVVPWYVPSDAMHSIDSRDCAWNPLTVQLEMATGLCYYTAPIPTTRAGFNFTAMCQGAESVVPYNITSVPGGNVFFGGLDVGMFANLNPNTYPSIGLPLMNYIGGLTACWDIQYSGQKPNFVVAMCSEGQGLENSGYTTTGGSTQKSWFRFWGIAKSIQPELCRRESPSNDGKQFRRVYRAQCM
jgi:hypothetical protein